MARSIAYLSISFSLWLTMAGTAWGQAAVEAGLGAGRAATTAAPARGVGKAIGGMVGSLDKVIKAGQVSDAQPVAPGTVEPAAKPAPASKWEDPSGIETGISYAELVRRFGPAALEISGEMGRTLTYSGKNGAYHVDVEGDKVTEVRKPKV